MRSAPRGCINGPSGAGKTEIPSWTSCGEQNGTGSRQELGTAVEKLSWPAARSVARGCHLRLALAVDPHRQRRWIRRPPSRTQRPDIRGKHHRCSSCECNVFQGMLRDRGHRSNYVPIIDWATGKEAHSLRIRREERAERTFRPRQYLRFALPEPLSCKDTLPLDHRHVDKTSAIRRDRHSAESVEPRFRGAREAQCKPLDRPHAVRRRSDDCADSHTGDQQGCSGDKMGQ